MPLLVTTLKLFRKIINYFLPLQLIKWKLLVLTLPCHNINTHCFPLAIAALAIHAKIILLAIYTI